MCGIAGWLSWNESPRSEVVQVMCDAMTHRGPDAGQVVSLGPVVLGHRRLAIIDTSPENNSPSLTQLGDYASLSTARSTTFESCAEDWKPKARSLEPKATLKYCSRHIVTGASTASNISTGCSLSAYGTRATSACFLRVTELAKSRFSMYSCRGVSSLRQSQKPSDSTPTYRAQWIRSVWLIT